MTKKLPIFFLYFLLLFGLVILALWFSTPPENVAGLTDTSFKTLQKSGETVASKPTSKWLALLYGIGIYGVFMFVLLLGTQKKDITIQKKFHRVILIGIVLHTVVYCLMVYTWWDYVATNSFDYFGGLPIPTAFMVYGVLTMPLFITFFYIKNFNFWVISEDEMVTFRKIVDNRREREKNNLL